jgi:hypothetical protein
MMQTMGHSRALGQRVFPERKTEGRHKEDAFKTSEKGE